MKRQMKRYVMAMAILCVCLAASGCSHGKGLPGPAGNGTTAKTAKPTPPTKPGSTASNKKTAWFEKGSLKDGVYANQQAKISITLPKGWTTATRDQLNQLTDSDYNKLTDQQKKSFDIQNHPFVYDFGAASGDGKETILFMVQMMDPGGKLDAEAYLNETKSQLVKTKISFQFGDITKRQLAGNTWKTILAKDRGMFQFFAAHQRDKRIEVLIISTPDTKKNSIDEILSGVSALK